MPRAVTFERDHLGLAFSGLLHFGTTTARFDVPYSRISDISTDPFRFPRGTLRWGGAWIPFTDIREGHFRHRGEWYFVSFEDRSKTVTLGLNHFTVHRRNYVKVVIQVDDPRKFTRELRRRVSARLARSEYPRWIASGRASSTEGARKGEFPKGSCHGAEVGGLAYSSRSAIDRVRSTFRSLRLGTKAREGFEGE
jgi:hypothetical protein